MHAVGARQLTLHLTRKSDCLLRADLGWSAVSAYHHANSKFQRCFNNIFSICGPNLWAIVCPYRLFSSSHSSAIYYVKWRHGWLSTRAVPLRLLMYIQSGRFVIYFAVNTLGASQHLARSRGRIRRKFNHSRISVYIYIALNVVFVWLQTPGFLKSTFMLLTIGADQLSTLERSRVVRPSSRLHAPLRANSNAQEAA